MSASFVRLVSRILLVCMIGSPFQVQAGLIGTDEVVSAAQARVARDAVHGFVDRTEVAGQLQALGLTPQAARDRIDALTDSEIARLAGQIESLPAGANGAGIGLLIIIVFLIWHFIVSPSMKETPKK